MLEAIMIDGKEVDPGTFEVDGIDTADYPDFCDAYISYAEFTDGTELTDEQLDKFDSEFVYNLVINKLF